MLFAILDLATFFLPEVTELPFGIDGAMETAISSFRAFMEVFPFFELPFYLFLFALGLEFMLMAWAFTKWFMQLIRGSG